MKRLLLVLIVVVALAVATVSPALATITLGLPNGNTVEGLPDNAINAATFGAVEIICADGTFPPCI